MSQFKVYIHDEPQDLSKDVIARELQSFLNLENNAIHQFLKSGLDLFEADFNELSLAIWGMHHAITTGEYPDAFDTHRAIEITPLFLNAARLAGETVCNGCIGHSCEHLLNVFWAHLKLSDPLQDSGKIIVNSAAEHFAHPTLDALSLQEIAWLAGISLASVANVASASDDNPRKLVTFKQDGKTLVSREEARRWLEKSPAFKPGHRVAKASTQDGQETVLVPVAKDGSFLNHSCVRSKGVQIGPKGDEVYYPSLETALAKFVEDRNKASEPARWRRPNHRGIFGIVTAVRWEERTRKDVFGDT